MARDASTSLGGRLRAAAIVVEARHDNAVSGCHRLGLVGECSRLFQRPAAASTRARREDVSPTYSASLPLRNRVSATRYTLTAAAASPARVSTSALSQAMNASSRRTRIRSDQLASTVEGFFRIEVAGHGVGASQNSHDDGVGFSLLAQGDSISSMQSGTGAGPPMRLREIRKGRGNRSALRRHAARTRGCDDRVHRTDGVSRALLQPAEQEGRLSQPVVVARLGEEGRCLPCDGGQVVCGHSMRTRDAHAARVFESGEPAVDRVHARHVAQLQRESLSPGVFADRQRDLGQPLGGGGYQRVPVGQYVQGTRQQVRRSRHVKASVGP